MKISKKLLEIAIGMGMLGSFIITDQGAVRETKIGDHTYYNTDAGNSYHEYKIGDRTYLQGDDGSNYSSYHIGSFGYQNQDSAPIKNPSRALNFDTSGEMKKPERTGVKTGDFRQDIINDIIFGE